MEQPTLSANCPRVVAQLADELENAMEAQRRGRMGRFVKACLLSGLAIAALTTLLRAFGLPIGKGGPYDGVFFGVYSIVVMPTLAYVFGPSRREKDLVGRLTLLHSQESIPVLISAMSIQHTGLRKSVMEALIRLLPQLDAQQGTWYGAKQRYQFRDTLKNCHSRAFGGHWPADYAVVVLGAVSVLEDTALIREVEALANRQQTDEKSVRIREAAAECRDVLQHAAERKRQQEQLLRPADGGSLALLHVVEAGEQEQSESLLRPVN